ncbi:MAG: hydroxymethylglutaryl-CoA lyase [Nocardioidaceae bacterium]
MPPRSSAQEYVGSPARLPFELPESVRVNEVGPRDGFQLEQTLIPTPTKIEIVDALSQSGLPGIQVTSFVRPDAVPQLADGDEVMSGIKREPGVEYAVLIPNLKGAERALEHDANVWETMLSVSDSHSRANANRDTAEALEGMRAVVELAHDNGVQVVGGMATALGCPFDGRIAYDRVAWVVAEYHGMGVRKVTIADTVGVADPAHVYAMSSRLRADFPDVEFALHLHDTRGLGLSNVLAGMAAGISDFDSSVGGLGGCPFAPGATGNIATEDLVHMLALLGVDTGVDLTALLDVSRDLVDPAIDHPLESSLSRADPSWRLHAAPAAPELKTS